MVRATRGRRGKSIAEFPFQANVSSACLVLSHKVTFGRLPNRLSAVLLVVLLKNAVSSCKWWWYCEFAITVQRALPIAQWKSSFFQNVYLSSSFRELYYIDAISGHGRVDTDKLEF